MKTKKVYIAGPISNNIDEYKAQFGCAEARLKEKGYLVMNPAILPLGFEYEHYMKISTEMLKGCDCIYMLTGYTESPGAMFELEIAEERGIEVSFENDIDALAYVVNKFFNKLAKELNERIQHLNELLQGGVEDEPADAND